MKIMLRRTIIDNNKFLEKYYKKKELSYLPCGDYGYYLRTEEKVVDCYDCVHALNVDHDTDFQVHKKINESDNHIISDDQVKKIVSGKLETTIVDHHIKFEITCLNGEPYGAFPVKTNKIGLVYNNSKDVCQMSYDKVLDLLLKKGTNLNPWHVDGNL